MTCKPSATDKEQTEASRVRQQEEWSVDAAERNRQTEELQQRARDAELGREALQDKLRQVRSILQHVPGAPECHLFVC